jgi:hypothetical protein
MINRELEDLPPPPSSAPLSEVLRLITDFTRETERQGEGVPGRHGLLHQIKRPQDNFRVAIRRTAPLFVPHLREKLAEEDGLMDCHAPLSARGSVTPAPATPASLSPTSASVTGLLSAGPGPHTYPPFLVGEEDSVEIGLNDGKEIFIDDVLETAEWCVPWLYDVNLSYNKLSEQFSHTGTSKQLSFHSPEGVHRCLRRPMGWTRTNAVHDYCREGKRSYSARCRHPFR